MVIHALNLLGRPIWSAAYLLFSSPLAEGVVKLGKGERNQVMPESRVSDVPAPCVSHIKQYQQMASNKN